LKSSFALGMTPFRNAKIKLNYYISILSGVKLKIAWIGKTKEPAIQALTDEYLKRISRYVAVEGVALRDEAALLEMCGRSSGVKSGNSALVLLDSRGKEFSSEGFARFLGDYQDRNPLPLVFAVGGADGFSGEAKSAAQHAISLGKMTLPHELARVVLLEQVYRAFTILKGHPYHSGH
jgi:23S rRNA (pseudouridine1915-N3)-methyltransferase